MRVNTLTHGLDTSIRAHVPPPKANIQKQLLHHTGVLASMIAFGSKSILASAIVLLVVAHGQAIELSACTTQPNQAVRLHRTKDYACRHDMMNHTFNDPILLGPHDFDGCHGIKLSLLWLK
jgi:hypothetical protein